MPKVHHLCALWAYLLVFVNKMATPPPVNRIRGIVTNKPPYAHLEVICDRVEANTRWRH
jgi:hypothetical protein